MTRAQDRRRSIIFSSTGVLLVLGILAAVNVLSYYVYARLDLSSGGVYSISRGSRAVLAQLKDTLLIKVYFSPRLPPPYGLNEQYLKDLLREYKSAGRGRVRLDFVNPEGSEALRREARGSGVAPVQINVMARDKFEVKEAYMGAVFLYKGKTEVLPVVDKTADLEYDITRRIKKLAAAQRKAVGFATGHGEKGPEDRFLAPLFELIREEMEVDSVSLDKPVPERLDSLWVLGPASRFKPEELDRLKAWVGAGKSLGLVLNRRAVNFQSFFAMPQETGLEPLLKSWGLELGAGFVADAQAERVQMETQYGQFVALRVQDYPFIPISTRLNAAHPASRGLDAVSFPFAHPLLPSAVVGLSFSSLADSSPASWHQESASLAPGQPIESLRSGPKGPFSLAGVIEGDFHRATPPAAPVSRPAPGRVVVVGTAYQFDGHMAAKPANVAFLMNLLEWSLQDEALLSIRAKGLRYRPLRRFGDAQRWAVKYLLVFFLPIMLLLAAAWTYRRQKLRRLLLPLLYAEADQPRREPESPGAAVAGPPAGEEAGSSTR